LDLTADHKEEIIMTVWAIGDLHLAFGVPNKEMDVFGAQWKDHPERVRKHWLENIKEEDLVLIPGDISWAMRLEEVKADLDWIDALPGTKVLLRGNHDYWWTSLKQIREILPSSIHLIQNDSFSWNDVCVGGARMWDTPEYSFREFIHFTNNPRENTLTKVEDPKEAEKIFVRELGRLEASLKTMDKRAAVRIVMTHYPPIGADLQRSRVSDLLEKYGVHYCVFGHLHNVLPGKLPFGSRNGVKYELTSCDYLNCTPIKL
jgi:uncharacterized protein